MLTTFEVHCVGLAHRVQIDRGELTRVIRDLPTLSVSAVSLSFPSGCLLWS